ncbi:MAG: XRE family transcriptional regulator [Proteobacteria bacterium]|nr:XRE family transcriptional regulator [Pseudomonadota bacterium]
MKTTLIVIQNDADHAEAKALVAKLMASNAPEDGAHLAAQARLMEDYERARWPRRVVGAADILAYLMEQHGLSRSDLVPQLGTASRVSEVLSGKRDLSMTMVQRLRQKFHISADALIPEGPPGRARKRIAA